MMWTVGFSWRRGHKFLVTRQSPGGPTVGFPRCRHNPTVGKYTFGRDLIFVGAQSQLDCRNSRCATYITHNPITALPRASCAFGKLDLARCNPEHQDHTVWFVCNINKVIE